MQKWQSKPKINFRYRKESRVALSRFGLLVCDDQARPPAPASTPTKLDAVLPAHMDEDGARFVERKSVEAAEHNVAASSGCS